MGGSAGRKGINSCGEGGGGSSIDIDINGEAFLSGVSTNQDIPVIDQNDNPIGEADGTDWRVKLYSYRDQWKSGAVTSFVSGDDASLQQGAGASFTTLAAGRTNVFDTTDRFTDELGGTTYAKDIVIDHATFDPLSGTYGGARAYYRVLYSGVNMDYSGGVPSAISACQGTSITGFTSGWEMANITQLNSLVDNEYLGTGDGFNYSPINHSIVSSATNIWANTYRSTGAGAARFTNNSVPIIVSSTGSARAMATRWVYWNPNTNQFQATAP